MEYLLMKYSRHHTMNKDQERKKGKEIKGKLCPEAPESMGSRWPSRTVQKEEECE